MIKKIKNLLWRHENLIVFVVALMYIILIVSQFRWMYYKDAWFPVSGYSSELHENLIYSWTDRLLGADTFLDKIRWASLFIFNSLWILSPIPYYLTLFILGFISSYILLSLFPSLSNKARIGIALFYIVNPFTILHITHFLILQGYFITPLIVFFYIKHLNSKNILSVYPPSILVATLFLGQPHNYANIFYILVWVWLFYFFYKKEHFFQLLLKNLLILFWAILLYSFVYLPFILSWRTSAIVDSNKSFSTTTPNDIWSSNSSMIDVFSITSNSKFFEHFFSEEKWTHAIFYILGSLSMLLLLYIIFTYLFKRTKTFIEKYVLAWFVLTIFIILIHRFDVDWVSEIVYKLLPHIKVSTDYAIGILLLLLISIFWYIHKKIIYVYIWLVQVFILFTLFSSSFFSTDVALLKSLSNDVKNYKQTSQDWYTFILPLAAKHSFSWLNSTISLLILGYDNFTIRHLTVEQMFSKTRSTIVEYLRNDMEWIFKNYPFQTFISYKEDPLIEYWLWSWFLIPLKNYWSFQSYKNTYFPWLFTSSDTTASIFIDRRNPIKYYIYIKWLKDSLDFSFLESYNKNWTFYIGENPLKNCIEERYIRIDRWWVNMVDCFWKSEGIDFHDLQNYKKNGISHEIIFDHSFYKEYWNSWKINKDTIIEKWITLWAWWSISDEFEKNRDESHMYRINPDGSIDVALTLFFKPQLYFYIGIIISSFTLFILIISILFFSISEWRNRGLYLTKVSRRRVNWKSLKKSI